MEPFGLTIGDIQGHFEATMIPPASTCWLFIFNTLLFTLKYLMDESGLVNADECKWCAYELLVGQV